VKPSNDIVTCQKTVAESGSFDDFGQIGTISGQQSGSRKLVAAMYLPGLVASNGVVLTEPINFPMAGNRKLTLLCRVAYQFSKFLPRHRSLCGPRAPFSGRHLEDRHLDVAPKAPARRINRATYLSRGGINIGNVDGRHLRAEVKQLALGNGPLQAEAVSAPLPDARFDNTNPRPYSRVTSAVIKKKWACEIQCRR
jgi:hypothetical protein